MISTEIRPTLSSLADLRDIPLDEMATAKAAMLGKAIAAILPESSVVPVPVAAFQSAI